MRSSMRWEGLALFSGEKRGWVDGSESRSMDSVRAASSCGCEGGWFSEGWNGSSVVIMISESATTDGASSCIVSSIERASGALWRAVGAGISRIRFDDVGLYSLVSPRPGCCASKVWLYSCRPGLSSKRKSASSGFFGLYWFLVYRSSKFWEFGQKHRPWCAKISDGVTTGVLHLSCMCFPSPHMLPTSIAPTRLDIHPEDIAMR